MTPWQASQQALLHSIGKPLEGAELRVVKADGRDAVQGEVGELWFRGAGVIPGYVGQQQDSSAFDDQGWMHSGDLGLVDGEGWSTSWGARRICSSRGLQRLSQRGGRRDCRLPRCADGGRYWRARPVLGEVGRYFVVPRPDAQINEAALQDYCRRHLADYKVPRQILLRQNLPLTPAGKIQKALLRQEGPDHECAIRFQRPPCDGVWWHHGHQSGHCPVLCRAGARVTVASRKQANVDAAVATLGAAALGVVADVRDEQTVAAALAQAVERHGPIDVLVSGAAGNFLAPADQMSSNAFKVVLDIDLLGSFHVAHHAVQHLHPGGSSLIFITAPQSVVPMAYQAHVCAAKAGVDQLTRVLALEWGHAVCVNAISPGPIAGTEGMRRLAPQGEQGMPW